MDWHRHDHDDPDRAHEDHHQIAEQLDDINRKLDHIMSDQSHLDADVQAILAEVNALDTTTTAIAQAIADLKVANPAVDFAGLEAATATLTTSVGTLGGLIAPPA